MVPVMGGDLMKCVYISSKSYELITWGKRLRSAEWQILLYCSPQVSATIRVTIVMALHCNLAILAIRRRREVMILLLNLVADIVPGAHRRFPRPSR